MMAAEVERQRKLAAHDPEPLGQVVGRALQQEIVIRRPLSRAVAPLPQQGRIENLRRCGHLGAFLKLRSEDPCRRSRWEIESDTMPVQGREAWRGSRSNDEA